MSQTFPVAGRKIFIGGLFTAPETGRLLTEDDFPDIIADTWIPIGKWQAAGALGGDQATITTSYLNEEYDDIQMGTKNPGTMPVDVPVEAPSASHPLVASAGDAFL